MSSEKEESTTLIITRHPVTPLNLNKIVQGSRSDIQLGPEGKEQAEELKEELLKYKINIILSSPMQRCVEGIEPYAKASGVPVVYVKYFRERDYGIFDGKTAESYAEWKDQHSIHENFDFAPPEGESFRDVRKRVEPELKRMLKKYEGKTILIMGHNATDIALMLSIFNQKEEDNYDTYKLSNASITIVEISKEVPKLKLLNYTAHLHSNNLSKTKERSK